MPYANARDIKSQEVIMSKSELMEKIREALDNGTYQEFHDKYVDLLDTRI